MSAAALLGSSPWRLCSPPCCPLLPASGFARARLALFPQLQAGIGHLTTRGDNKQVLLPWPPLFIYGYLPWQPCSPQSTRSCPSSRASGSACARPALFPQLQVGGGHLTTCGDNKQVLLPRPPPFIYGYLPWQPCSPQSTHSCPLLRTFKAPCAHPVVPSLSTGERWTAEDSPEPTCGALQLAVVCGQYERALLLALQASSSARPRESIPTHRAPAPRQLCVYCSRQSHWVELPLPCVPRPWISMGFRCLSVYQRSVCCLKVCLSPEGPSVA